MDINKLLLGLHTAPFIITVWAGLLWPLIQASLDKPWWTRRRRVTVVAVIGAIVTAAVWVSGHYPATWQMLLTQLSMFLGVAWSVYQVMSAIRINGHSLLEWVGYTTPGGETRPPAQDPVPDQARLTTRVRRGRAPAQDPGTDEEDSSGA